MGGNDNGKGNDNGNGGFLAFSLKNLNRRERKRELSDRDERERGIRRFVHTRSGAAGFGFCGSGKLPMVLALLPFLLSMALSTTESTGFWFCQNWDW